MLAEFAKTKVHLIRTSHAGTARLCIEGLMSSFSVFSLEKTEPWEAASPCLHRFEGGGAQFVEGACCATQICFPLRSFPQTYVPLPNENSISVKLCQILQYAALKKDYVLISQFRNSVCDSVIYIVLYSNIHVIAVGSVSHTWLQTDITVL